MAKGVGLDAGEYEIKVVELDGSIKRPRLAKISVDRVSQISSAAGDETHAAREAESALHALKDAHVSRENVVLGFPCREAVLRSLEVPFKGADQIRKVIKFEVEDTIHSHNVDDMVVDFHVLGEVEAGTRVLVAAVPKQPLRVTLDALNGLGIDPEVVDLDTLALFRAARFAGCFNGLALETEEDEADEPTTAVVAGSSARARVVIDIGGRSTRVLAVVDGELVDMRALRVGVDGIAEDVAVAKGIELPDAREAVFKVFESGEAQSISSTAAADLEVETDEERALVPAEESAVVLSPDEVSSAASELLRRMHRELVRFVASMRGIDSVEAVFVTGGGSFLPGVDRVIEDVFGRPPRPLPILAKLNHNLDEEEARWVEPRIAVAVGLALGAMGALPAFQFRQEDLAFQRRFDRIKFPLSIACMLALFMLFIYGMRLDKQLEYLGHEYGATYEVDRTDARGRVAAVTKATLYGYAGYLMNDGNRYGVSKKLGRKDYQALVEKVVEADTFDRLDVIEKFLRDYVKKQRQLTGIYEDLQLPSGYLVLARFAELITRVQGELGSFTVLEINLDYGTRNPFLQFKIALRGSDYRARFDRFLSVMTSTAQSPDSPFGEVESSDEKVYQTDVDGAIYAVRINLEEVKS